MIPPKATKDPTFLLTAHEAYPAFEREMLSAQSEIWIGFRVFDPTTKLQSGEACEIGSDWFDLLAHTLSRGVKIRLIISDFDPVVRPELHRGTWRSVRMALAAAEISGRPDMLRVTAAMHPARVGRAMSAALWLKVRGRLSREARRLNGLKASERNRALADMPRFAEQMIDVGGSLRPRYWPPVDLAPVTHHHKLAVFDRKRLYVGGLDLNNRRYDTLAHDRPGRDTWHDTQLITDGPEVGAAQAHLESFLDVVSGTASQPKTDPVFLRTMSKRLGPQPALRMAPEQCINEIAQAHYAEVAKSERLIYFETQFFRDKTLAQALVKAAGNNPELKLILILPAAPEEVAFQAERGSDMRYGEYMQAKCVDMVQSAFGPRAFIGSPAQPKPSDQADGPDQLGAAPLIYVHSKVSIFDSRCAIVSSANLNGRSFYWDTEAGVKVTDPASVTQLRQRCFEHWLPSDAHNDFYSDFEAVVEWSDLARINAKRAPADRRGFLMPYPLGRAKRFGRNLPGVPEQMV